MSRKRFTCEQIALTLHQTENGAMFDEACRNRTPLPLLAVRPAGLADLLSVPPHCQCWHLDVWPMPGLKLLVGSSFL